MAMSFLRGAGALLCLSLSVPASAIERQGVEFAPRVEVDGKMLLLNGLGLRRKTIFKAKVYLAGLYVPARNADAAAIMASPETKRLDIVFLRDVKADDIATSWDEGLEKNCTSGCEVFAARLKRLKDASIDVKKGQRITFVFKPEGLVVQTEGSMASYEGKDFADLILRNFLGEPPSEDVKAGLLGVLDPLPAEELGLTPAPRLPAAETSQRGSPTAGTVK